MTVKKLCRNYRTVMKPGHTHAESHIVAIRQVPGPDFTTLSLFLQNTELEPI